MVLERYFWVSYLVLVLIGLQFVWHIGVFSFRTLMFAAAVLTAYSFVFMLPLKLLIQGLHLLLRKLFNPAWITYPLAVVSMVAVDLVLFTDAFIYRMYGFHINAFVLNIITTKGGIESLGGDTSTKVTFIALIAGFAALHTAILFSLLRWDRMRKLCDVLLSSRARLAITLAILLMLAGQGLAFGYSALKNYTPVLEAADAFPLYMRVTFASLAGKLGIEETRREGMEIRVRGSSHLKYPLHLIAQRKDHTNYNIVWLVAESWRHDMLDPNIMPSTWRFAEQAIRFDQTYSAGNGTRMAVFGMFYGLYGNYWFEFLQQQRGPVLFDVLHANDYQMEMYTSARFTYPEFDKTVFASIPKEKLHEHSGASTTWQVDRENVNRLLGFIEGRDPNRPFMTFMFFESPHARYQFPPECAIAKPYLETFNYATADIESDIGLIKNRYINSCNHLDTQFARIIDYLQEKKLLDSTIVIMTGDHGEEFMEAGRWGHNSDYTDWQTRVPLVLWVPGVQPSVVTRMTSHLDLPATVLASLGVTNPPADYSLGFNMLGSKSRDYTIVSDWYDVVCVDNQYKAVFPLKGAITHQTVTAKDDSPVADKGSYYQSRKAMLLKVMKELEVFGG